MHRQQYPGVEGASERASGVDVVVVASSSSRSTGAREQAAPFLSLSHSLTHASSRCCCCWRHARDLPTSFFLSHTHTHSRSPPTPDCGCCRRVRARELETTGEREGELEVRQREREKDAKRHAESRGGTSDRQAAPAVLSYFFLCDSSQRDREREREKEGIHLISSQLLGSEREREAAAVHLFPSKRDRERETSLISFFSILPYV